jgi:hypothetical protein
MGNAYAALLVYGLVLCIYLAIKFRYIKEMRDGLHLKVIIKGRSYRTYVLYREKSKCTQWFGSWDFLLGLAVDLAKLLDFLYLEGSRSFLLGEVSNLGDCIGDSVALL